MSTEKVDVARLLVTELVANAVQHGWGIVLLVVARDGEGGVRVYVDDENPNPPVVIEPRSLMESGAGMRLVAALADGWGVAARGDGQPGKRVWFSLL
jgi:anti-sigma regulatory factor (Ser/Thr protein kinase)